MSIKNWPGGVINKTPVTPTGPYETGTAPGVWTLDQVADYVKQGIWPTAGLLPNYIEDVFSTYLYTGNDSVQTITNGIDLAGKGGLIWLKKRNNTSIHGLWDTARGGTKRLRTEDTGGESTLSDSFSFNSNGFTIPAGGSSYLNESSSNTYASWTFREQPKFFDVVTWTGNGTAGRTVAHNLGAVPGCIIVKSSSYAGTNWAVYHRSLTSNQYALQLNNTAAQLFKTAYWNSTTPTSTVFTLGDDADVNENGQTYVAYLFAHDAGGFGLTGTDNVISCGSFNYNTDPQTVTLGYEPQWLMVKQTDGSGDWIMFDNMRGFTTASSGGAGKRLLANTDGAETNNDGLYYGGATGFNLNLPSYGNYIYIAIRRGPMKTPTSGASVFTPTTYTGNGTSQTESAGFPTDMAIITNRGAGGGYERNVGDRLRGRNRTLFTTLTVAENTGTNRITGFDNMVGVSVGSDGDVNQSSGSQIAWNFRRAPGFFDAVCYTGTGSATTFSHNLGVVPELMIVKNRNNAENWGVYSAALGNTKRLRLNSTDASVTASAEWNNTSPTASVFTVGTDQEVNFSGNTYVNYLFATVAGVSKVGSYTGTGTTQQVNCGFAAGARFVLIKRTDSTGDWYVWDSARGIVSGNDPYLLLNSTTAEVTSTDYVDTYSAGFEISSTAPAAINANGGTFIFLAIA